MQISGGTPLTGPAFFGGSLALTNAYAGQPLWWDSILDNFGTPNGTSAIFLTELPSCLARNPQVILVGGLHNDAILGIPIATTYANYLSVVNQILARGIIPVLVLDPSMNSNLSSAFVTLAQLRSMIITYNNFIRYVAADKGLLTWDWHTPTLDKSSALGAVLSTMTDDSVHLNLLGNQAVALQGSTDLKSILGSAPQSILATDQNDAYDATYNPYGNLLALPLFLTGGGSVAGAWTGTMAQSWGSGTNIVGTGKTLALSLVTAPSGVGQAVQMAISGVSTGGNNNEIAYIFAPFNFQSSLPAGTIVEGWVDVDVSANSPFTQVWVKLAAGANQSYCNYMSGTPGYVAPGNPGTTAAWSATLYCGPMVIPATGFIGLNLTLQVQYNDVGGSFAGTAKWSRPAVRIVQNPY